MSSDAPGAAASPDAERGARTRTYAGVSALRRLAVRLARSCSACRVTPLRVVAGEATRYDLCERHHQSLYRRWAVRWVGETRRVDARSVRELAAALDGANAVSAARALAARGADAPEAVLPAVPALRRAVAAQRTAAFPNESLLEAAGTALGHVARRDGDVRSWLTAGVDATADAPARVRAASAGWRALALAPTHDAPLDPPVASLVAIVRRNGSASSDALTALAALARRHPMAVSNRMASPHADALRAAATDETRAVLASVVLGWCARARGDGAAAVGDGCGFAPGRALVGATDAHASVRRLVDPSRYADPVVREAAAVLGVVGDAADAAFLGRAVVPTLSPATRRVARDALAAVHDAQGL